MIFTISPRIFVPRCILLYKYVLYTLLSKTHRRVWHLNKNINVKEHRNAPHTHHSRKSFYLFRNKYNIITVYLNTGVFMTETSSGEWPCAKLQICVCHFVYYITTACCRTFRRFGKRVCNLCPLIYYTYVFLYLPRGKNVLSIQYKKKLSQYYQLARFVFVQVNRGLGHFW